MALWADARDLRPHELRDRLNFCIDDRTLLQIWSIALRGSLEGQFAQSDVLDASNVDEVKIEDFT